MAVEASYRLSDAPELSAESPYTFFLPADADLGRLGPGDYVKLIFELIPPGENYAAERMWVRVTAVEGDTLVGTLENDPLEGKMCAGDIVSFTLRNVVEIMWADGFHPSLVAPKGEYWERCLVDDCVLSGEEPVEYLYREQPDLELQGDDEEADSGWRIRGRRGSASDMDMDAREISYVALGAVLNRDDSWLHLIDAPVGSRFVRDFETGRYAATRNKEL
jgi:hypothetical protein